VKAFLKTMKENLDSCSSEEAKYYEDIADDAGDIINQKNAAFLNGCEILADAIGKLNGSGDYKEIFNAPVFKDFQSTLSVQNKLTLLLNKSDETRCLIRSGFSDIEQQLSDIAEILEKLEKYMYDFTNLDTTHVFLPDLISPFAKAVVKMRSDLRGENNSISHEEFKKQQKELSDTTKQKNGFMKVIRFIFEKHPEVKNVVSKNSTMKKIISKLEPGRKRGRPKGSTSKKTGVKRQKTGNA
jgi:hypothetical protein